MAEPTEDFLTSNCSPGFKEMIEAMRHVAAQPDFVEIQPLSEPDAWTPRPDGFGDYPLWTEDSVCRMIKQHVLADRALRDFRTL